MLMSSPSKIQPINKIEKPFGSILPNGFKLAFYNTIIDAHVKFSCIFMLTNTYFITAANQCIMMHV